MSADISRGKVFGSLSNGSLSTVSGVSTQDIDCTSDFPHTLSICEPDGNTVDYEVTAGFMCPRGDSLGPADERVAGNSFHGQVRNGCDKYKFYSAPTLNTLLSRLWWRGGRIRVWIDGNQITNLRERPWADGPPVDDPDGGDGTPLPDEMSICEPNGDAVSYHVVAGAIEGRDGSLEPDDTHVADNAIEGTVRDGCDRFSFKAGSGAPVQYLGWEGGDINVWINGQSINLNNVSWADPPEGSDPVNPCVAVQTADGPVFQCGPGGGEMTEVRLTVEYDGREDDNPTRYLLKVNGELELTDTVENNFSTFLPDARTSSGDWGGYVSSTDLVDEYIISLPEGGADYGDFIELFTWTKESPPPTVKVNGSEIDIRNTSWINYKSRPNWVDPPLRQPTDLQAYENKLQAYIHAYFGNRGRTRRPISPGTHLGNNNAHVGTLGWIAERDGEYYIASNHHVLALANKRGGNGQISNASPKNIKNADDYTIAEAGMVTNADGSSGDWATVKLVDGVSVSNYIVSDGPITESRLRFDDVDVGTEVRKSGRSTGVTGGKITGKKAIPYHTAGAVKNFVVDGMRVTWGDSGSPVYIKGSREPIGFVSGMTTTTGDRAYVTPLDYLYDAGYTIPAIPSRDRNITPETLEIRSTGGQARYMVKTAGNLIPTNDSLESGDVYRRNQGPANHDYVKGAVAGGGSDTFKFEGPILNLELFPKENVEVIRNGVELQKAEVEGLEASGSSGLGILALGALALASRSDE